MTSMTLQAQSESPARVETTRDSMREPERTFELSILRRKTCRRHSPCRAGEASISSELWQHSQWRDAWQLSLAVPEDWAWSWLKL